MNAHKIIDSIDIPTIISMGFAVTLIDLELILKITFWVFSISYLLWKWRVKYVQNKKDNG